MRSHRSKGVPFTQVEQAEFGFAKPGRVRQYGLEYRLQFAGRARDDAQHFRCGFLSLQRLVALTGELRRQFSFCGRQRMNCVDGSSLAHRDAFAFWSCDGAT
jgi:hypothetical protein